MIGPFNNWLVPRFLFCWFLRYLHQPCQRQGVIVVCKGGACSLQSVFLSLLVIKPLARGSTLLFPFLLPSAHHKCLIYPPSIHLFTSLAESRLETVVVWTMSKVICSFHAFLFFFLSFHQIYFLHGPSALRAFAPESCSTLLLGGPFFGFARTL